MRWDEEAGAGPSRARRRAWEADALIVATGQLHQPAYSGIRWRANSPATASTRRDGTTTTTCATSASRSSARGRAPCSSSRRSPSRRRKSSVFQRTGNWFLPRKNRATPRSYRGDHPPVPGVQRSGADSCSGTARTLTTHDPPPAHGRARSARRLARCSCAASCATPSCARGLAGLHLRVQARAVLLDFPARTAAPERGARHRADRADDGARSSLPTGVEHAVDCIIYATGFRSNDFMLPMEITGRRSHASRGVGGGATRLPGMMVPGFPSLFLMYGPNTNTSGGSIIVYEEAQAAYLRQALELAAHDARRSTCARRWRRRVTARCRRASPARRGLRATPGTATTPGRIVANWPGYMHEYIERVRRLDPADFELV